MAFSPDGKTLAAAGGEVWLWNLTDPARPAPLGPPLTGPTDRVTSVAFSPDGKTLAAGSDDSTAQMWNLDVDDAIQRICATTSNILTPDLRKGHLCPARPPERTDSPRQLRRSPAGHSALPPGKCCD